jgi:membrane protein YdbS with pleckstrin-like domain
MVERLIRSAGNLLLVVAFTLLLPFFCAAAWLWGSADERWLMKVALCVLSPFTAVFYYIIASHLLLRRRSSFFIQFLVFGLTAYSVWWVVSTGRLTF